MPLLSGKKAARAATLVAIRSAERSGDSLAFQRKLRDRLPDPLEDLPPLLLTCCGFELLPKLSPFDVPLLSAVNFPVSFSHAATRFPICKSVVSRTQAGNSSDSWFRWSTQALPAGQGPVKCLAEDRLWFRATPPGGGWQAASTGRMPLRIPSMSEEGASRKLSLAPELSPTPA